MVKLTGYLTALGFLVSIFVGTWLYWQYLISGEPVPGFLVTIVIGSVCAGWTGTVFGLKKRGLIN